MDRAAIGVAAIGVACLPLGIRLYIAARLLPHDNGVFRAMRFSALSCSTLSLGEKQKLSGLDSDKLQKHLGHAAR